MIYKPDQFIVSVVSQNIRSTGDIFQSGVVGNTYYQIDTFFANTEEFNALSQNIVSNPTMASFVGAISMDGLYVPYSTYAGHTGLLPHFETPSSSGDKVGNVTALNPFNPSGIFGSGIKSVGSVDYGTYNPSVWQSGGHNITAAMTVNEYATNTTMNSGVHPISNAFDSDFHFRKKTEISEIRGIAHRAPIILSGWGVDTDGSLVPTGASPDKLHPEALWNTSLWKTGPLDVRWDDARKVWSGGEGSKIISFQVVSNNASIGSRGVAAEALQRTFQGPIYGAYIGSDIVDVYDTDGCFFNEPELIARRGKAILTIVDSGAINTHWSGYSYSNRPTKYWNVLSLCCPNLECIE